MQVTVFGASGKVGSLVVEELLKRRHTVVAFVHSHNLFSPSGNLIVLQGDVYKKEDVTRALQGSEAVISCLGSWGTPKRNVLITAMRAIIPAMQEQNISRIITLTGSGAVEPGKPLKVSQELFLKLLAPFPAGKVFRDGMEHMNLLAASNLEWTTLRSPVMTNGGAKDYYLNLKVGGPLETISRIGAARALVDQLEADDYLRMAPVLHRN